MLVAHHAKVAVVGLVVLVHQQVVSQIELHVLVSIVVNHVAKVADSTMMAAALVVIVVVAALVIQLVAVSANLIEAKTNLKLNLNLVLS
jgi:uncharacterized membrane-anchored protein